MFVRLGLLVDGASHAGVETGTWLNCCWTYCIVAKFCCVKFETT